MEVIEYTGSVPNYGFMLQPCIFHTKISGANHACWVRDGTYTFKDGVIETRYISRTMKSAWNYGCLPGHWDNIVDYMQIDNYLNDKGTNKGIPKPKVRTELYIVEKDGTFEAPEHWVEPADWSACYKGCKETAGVNARTSNHPQPSRQIFSLQNANGIISIGFANESARHSISAYNAKGSRIIYLSDVRGQTLNLSPYLPQAEVVYMLSVKSNDAAQTQRLIIQR
jgi:hypothetical protein